MRRQKLVGPQNGRWDAAALVDCGSVWTHWEHLSFNKSLAGVLTNEPMVCHHQRSFFFFFFFFSFLVLVLLRQRCLIKSYEFFNSSQRFNPLGWTRVSETTLRRLPRGWAPAARVLMKHFSSSKPTQAGTLWPAIIVWWGLYWYSVVGALSSSAFHSAVMSGYSPDMTFAVHWAFKKTTPVIYLCIMSIGTALPLCLLCPLLLFVAVINYSIVVL